MTVSATPPLTRWARTLPTPTCHRRRPHLRPWTSSRQSRTTPRHASRQNRHSRPRWPSRSRSNRSLCRRRSCLPPPPPPSRRRRRRRSGRNWTDRPSLPGWPSGRRSGPNRRNRRSEWSHRSQPEPEPERPPRSRSHPVRRTSSRAWRGCRTAWPPGSRPWPACRVRVHAAWYRALCRVDRRAGRAPNYRAPCTERCAVVYRAVSSRA